MSLHEPRKKQVTRLKTDKFDKIACGFGSMLTFVAFLIWLFSINQAKLNLEIGPDIRGLGLITILPTTFFVSISLLTSAFLISLRSNKNQMLLFFQIITLVSFLDFTPTLIETTPRFLTTYLNYSSVDYILQKGYINPLASWTHNWPGFSLLYCAFMHVTSLPEQLVLSLYPTFSDVLLFFPLYVLFDMVSGDEKHKWISIWIFYTVNWIGQNYFSFQSLGFFICTSMLFITFKMENLKIKTRCQSDILLILFFSVLVFSHILSSLALLAILIGFFVLRYFQKSGFLALSIILVVSWTVYGAAAYSQLNLQRFVTEVFNVGLIYEENIAKRITGSAARIAVTQIRVIFSAIVSIFALSGMILMWKHKQIRNFEKRNLAILVAIVCLVPLFTYGGELFERIYLFSLIPLAYFISKNSSSKTLFCFLMIFMIVIVPPLHVIAHYGNEAMDYVPIGEIKGVEFFYNTTKQGYIMQGYYARDYKYRQTYKFFFFSGMEWKNNKLIVRYELTNQEWPRFVWISRGDRERYNFYLGEPEFINGLQINLTRSAYYNKIYSNPSLDVYIEKN